MPGRFGPDGNWRWRWGPSAIATLIWLVAVGLEGQFGRVAEHWESTLTMLAGSFLAGSSPEGGGAVAFPVFTKALEVPAPVARTFGLSIQAVGMGMASLAILIAGRPIHRRSVLVGVPAAIVGFLAGLFVLGRSAEPFWPSTVPTPWIKATFSIVLATATVLMVRQLRLGNRAVDDPPVTHRAWNGRLDLALVVVAVAGGVLSSLTGTGANIMVFLFLVVVVGVLPKTALPTCIIVMAAVSMVGLALLALADGQFDLTIAGDRVTEVGGQSIDLPLGGGDLLGLWLAAVPVVIWGAPLGSLAASLVREHHLVWFVAFLASVEVATTFLLVPEFRTEPGLLAYLVVGLVAMPTAFVVAARSPLVTGAPQPGTGSP